MKITVALCTRRRPVMLRRALEGIASLNTGGIALSVVVVENDDGPENRSLVESFADQLDIHYAHEPRQGLCFARNRALDEALATGPNWIATTDDDTWPDPDWLLKMRDMVEAHPEADAIAGHTRAETHATGKWSLPGPSAAQLKTGAKATYMSTSNFFILASVIAEGFRFDPAYNLTGGEDTDFLRGLRVAGKTVLWTNEAIVNAPISEDREGLRYGLWRRVAGYSQMPSIRRKYDGTLKGTLKIARRILRIFVRALADGLLGLGKLLMGRPEGPRYLMQALDGGATALGLFLGMIGYRVQAYRVTDGK